MTKNRLIDMTHNVSNQPVNKHEGNPCGRGHERHGGVHFAQLLLVHHFADQRPGGRVAAAANGAQPRDDDVGVEVSGEEAWLPDS